MKKETELQKVQRLISWHKFITTLLNTECVHMREFLQIHNPMTHKDLRLFTTLSGKIEFLTQEQFKAEHDLISAAIIYGVPHISLLQDHPEDFYILLEAKVKKICESEVIISKI